MWCYSSEYFCYDIFGKETRSVGEELGGMVKKDVLNIWSKVKSGSGTLNNGIPNNPKTVHRFMSKQEYKEFKKNGFVFNPNAPREGISSTSTKIKLNNPARVKERTGALGRIIM